MQPAHARLRRFAYTELGRLFASWRRSAAKPEDSGNILPLSRCGTAQLMAKQ